MASGASGNCILNRFDREAPAESAAAFAAAAVVVAAVEASFAFVGAIGAAAGAAAVAVGALATASCAPFAVKSYSREAESVAGWQIAVADTAADAGAIAGIAVADVEAIAAAVLLATANDLMTAPDQATTESHRRHYWPIYLTLAEFAPEIGDDIAEGAVIGAVAVAGVTRGSVGVEILIATAFYSHSH